MTEIQFIVLAQNKWQSRWMNRQQLFSRIGKEYNVVYGNGAIFTWHFTIKKFFSSLFQKRYVTQDNITVINPSYTFLRSHKVKSLDNISIANYLAKITEKTSKDKPIVLYIFNPKFVEYVKYIKHDYLVFHAYDDYSKQKGFGDQLKQYEQSLATQADLIIASSLLIRDRYLESEPESKVKFVPNGVDYDTFSRSYEQPVELENIPQPRVGYVGAINLKADLALWFELASHFKDVSFVLVGPADQLTGEGLSIFNKLKGLKNSFYLGSKDKDQIASYMHHFDINTMIYKTNKSGWASSGYPLKLHEYLAVGKPVISSDIEAVRSFSNVVSIAEGVDEWVDSINSFLNESNPSNFLSKRREVAKSNTWECRTESILSYIKQLDKS